MIGNVNFVDRQNDVVKMKVIVCFKNPCKRFNIQHVQSNNIDESESQAK